MGRARRGQSGNASDAKRDQLPVKLPRDLTNVLSPDTAQAWEELAPILPGELYLGGGTAVAAHLHHRESRDLDFFYHADAVDLQALKLLLERTGKFALIGEAAGTLRGLYGGTKLEFFHADINRPHTQIKSPAQVAGLRIVSVPDLPFLSSMKGPVLSRSWCSACWAPVRGLRSGLGGGSSHPSGRAGRTRVSCGARGLNQRGGRPAQLRAAGQTERRARPSLHLAPRW